MFAINGGELSKPAYYRFMTKPNRSFKHGAANVPVETTLIRVLDYNPEKSDLDFRPQAMINNVVLRGRSLSCHLNIICNILMIMKISLQQLNRSLAHRQMLMFLIKIVIFISGWFFENCKSKRGSM